MTRRLLAERASSDAARAAVRTYFERMTLSPRLDYRRYAQALVEYNCQFAADLHNTMNAAQRQALVGKLKGWEADLRALSASATP